MKSVLSLYKHFRYSLTARSICEDFLAEQVGQGPTSTKARLRGRRSNSRGARLRALNPIGLRCWIHCRSCPGTQRIPRRLTACRQIFQARTDGGSSRTLRRHWHTAWTALRTWQNGSLERATSEPWISSRSGEQDECNLSICAR
jgi:hypothetical protein